MDLIPAVSVRRGRVVCAECDGYRELGGAANVVRQLSRDYKKILFVDIDAIEGREPQLDLIQELSEEDCELWVDAGVQCAGDLVHPFVAGATIVVAGTKAVRSLDAFEEIYRISGEVVPSVELMAGKVVWGGEEAPPFGEVLERLDGIGYGCVVIVDLGRRAAQGQLDSEFVRRAVEMGFDVYAGGGVSREGAKELEALGAKGAILELRSVLGERD